MEKREDGWQSVCAVRYDAALPKHTIDERLNNLHEHTRATAKTP